MCLTCTKTLAMRGAASASSTVASLFPSETVCSVSHSALYSSPPPVSPCVSLGSMPSSVCSTNATTTKSPLTSSTSLDHSQATPSVKAGNFAGDVADSAASSTTSSKEGSPPTKQLRTSLATAVGHTVAAAVAGPPRASAANGRAMHEAVPCSAAAETTELTCSPPLPQQLSPPLSSRQPLPPHRQASSPTPQSTAAVSSSQSRPMILARQKAAAGAATEAGTIAQRTASPAASAAAGAAPSCSIPAGATGGECHPLAAAPSAATGGLSRFPVVTPAAIGGGLRFSPGKVAGGLRLSAAAAAETGGVAPRFTIYGTRRRTKSCPYCGPGESSDGRGGQTIVFDASSGDQLCRECGFIVEEKVLSEEQEWRNFSAEVASNSRGGADRNRVGEALDVWFDDGGVGTTMLLSNSSNPLGGSRAVTNARRLQQLHEATTAGFMTGSGGTDRQLRAAFSCLRLIGEAFALRDNVLERAKEIAKDLLDGQQFRTRSNVTTMLAVTYLACREAGVTRTVKELAVYDRAVTEKELGKAINRIKKLLPQRGGVSSAESATQLLPRFCSRLQLSMHVSDVAEHVAKRAAQVIVSSHRPNSIAGAAIWLVVQLLNSTTNPHLPKASEIASVTGAGEHTLRSICKDMLDVAEHLLPREFQPTVDGGLDGLRARNARKRKGLEYSLETF